MSAMAYPIAWMAVMKREPCAHPAMAINLPAQDSPQEKKRFAYRNVGDATATQTALMGPMNVSQYVVKISSFLPTLALKFFKLPIFLCHMQFSSSL